MERKLYDKIASILTLISEQANFLIGYIEGTEEKQFEQLEKFKENFKIVNLSDKNKEGA